MELFASSCSSKLARETYSNIEIKNQAPYVLGPYNTHHLLSDAKRIGFLFARYKFVAKMFDGMGRVLEIGCQEGLGSLVVAQAVGNLVASDFYLPHIQSCNERNQQAFQNVEFRSHDIISGPISECFDAAYSLDVMEHIDPVQEGLFLGNIAQSLLPLGAAIIGMPSLESQQYASEGSRQGHINCKTGKDLKAACLTFFNHVFMFGMNDEVLHTGFMPMSHYLLALCIGPKKHIC